MAQTDPVVVDKLITARISLLLQQPFFGNLATRLQLVEASEWCKTAATDGRRIYYNTEFIKKISPNKSTKKIEFLLAHEVMHCILDHFGRLGNRHPKLANIAQDYAVNQILVDDRIGEKITEVPICLDDKHRGKPWEQIYDELYEKAEKISLEDLLSQLGEQLDDHLEEDKPGGDGEDEDKDGSGKSGSGKKPKLSKEELEDIRKEIKEAMLQAAQAAGAGKVPAGIQRLINEMTTAKVDWRQYIQQEIQSILRNDYSFTRPNRKGWASGAILPGLKEATRVEVACAIDMSGSISNKDAAAFLSEIKGIVEQFEDFTIDLWCFDTEVYNHKKITQDNIHDLDDYEPQGGGGTMFEVNWDFMKENDIEPKKFIMFTDGCPGGGWGDELYCDTIFLVKGNTRAESPFGQTVIYEELANA